MVNFEAFMKASTKPVPKVWGEANKEKFKEVKSNFLAYLAGCYSESHLILDTFYY